MTNHARAILAILARERLNHPPKEQVRAVSTVTDFLEALDGLVVTQQDYYRAQEAVQIIHDGKMHAWRRAENAEYQAQVEQADRQWAIARGADAVAMADRNAEIRALVGGGMTCRQVGERYDLSASMVSRIARGLVAS